MDHFVPQSHDETGRNDYSNCFYACRLCNIARGDTPNDDGEGRSLLEPCGSAWSGVFDISRDKIRLRHEGNGDAEYTLATYDLNDRRKVRMRRLRRLAIRRSLHFLERSRIVERNLIAKAEARGDEELVKAAEMLSVGRRLAYMELSDLLAVPHDRDAACRCGHTTHHHLPVVLEEQTIDIS